MKKDGEEPYPHKFHVTISLEEFIEKFNSLNESQILHDEQYSVAGKHFSYSSCMLWNNMYINHECITSTKICCIDFYMTTIFKLSIRNCLHIHLIVFM